MSSLDDHVQPEPLVPAGQRWGRGARSVAPYLREAWSSLPRNPVFTPQHVAALVWPARHRAAQNRRA